MAVVTPFYNSAAYLEHAIGSVLEQSHDNFEYILADNCSTDGSLAIAEAWAGRDPRIRVYRHDRFLDQDANYNRALGYVSPTADWVKVVQADDRIFPDCLALMVAAGAANPTAGIVAGCFLAGDVLAGGGLPFDREFFTGREACRVRLLQGGTYFGSPTCLLYRGTVVRERPDFYRADETNADTTACFEILEHCDFVRVPQLVCWLRRDDESISARLQRLGTAALLNYALVCRYGNTYLTADELAARRTTLRTTYLRTLARRWFDRPGTDFWDFHRHQLAKLGEPWPAGELRSLRARYVIAKLVSPGQKALDQISERLRPRPPAQ